MWRILVADDEPRIQRGLKAQIERMGLDVEVADVAGDGEIAFQMAKELAPDIMLVDICMPFLNGLEMIEKLRALGSRTELIVVTGFEEFDYARKALDLGVSAYLLKPVEADELRGALEKAISSLMARNSRDRHYAWAISQLEKRKDTLRETFLWEAVSGELDAEELAEPAAFFGLDGLTDIYLMLISPEMGAAEERPLPDFSLRYALEGALGGTLDKCGASYLFADDSGNVLALVEGPLPDALEDDVKRAAETGLGTAVNMTVESLSSFADLSRAYDALLERARDGARNPDAVEKARGYIFNNFMRQDLGLEEVAAHVDVNPAYLSRMMKRALGVGFSRFLTMTRIERAVRLMDNRNLLLRDIAERVGYASPFYFSTAFKKVLGVSPAEYRAEGGRK